MQVEEEGNHYLMSREEIENKIATLTGGRAAEEVEFGTVTTGAANDIEQATRLARAMITRYGMSDEFDMVAMETVTNQYLGGDTSLACSAETQALIDRKVVELVRTQHEKALKILRDNKRKLDEIAEYLYFKETITGEEFMNILNRKPEPRLIGTSEDKSSDMSENITEDTAEAGQNPDETDKATDHAAADHMKTDHAAADHAVTDLDREAEDAESDDSGV